MTKLLAHFGAGNIGRSLIGQLFSRAGWNVVFLDVADDVIAALNRCRRYDVTIKDDLLPGEAPVIPVENVSGIHLRDDDAVRDILLRADLVGTSVGGQNLPDAARRIAAALPGRSAPLPVMLCENLHNAAAIMTGHIDAALRETAASPASAGAAPVHCIEAAISKMVPATPAAVRDSDPLAVWAEAYNTLYLDRDACPGTPPVVPGVAWRGNFQAYVDRKLLLHNFGHAAAAYCGFLAGKRYIYECMEERSVLAVTAGAMYEAARGLAVRHADVFTFDENRAWADDLLRRFRNAALADPVVRVGRDLRRKLAPGDRCIGALRLLQETGLPMDNAARAVAAGLFFAPAEADGGLTDDREIVDAARRDGPEAVLSQLSRLDPVADAAIVGLVTREYWELAARPPAEFFQ